MERSSPELNWDDIALGREWEEIDLDISLCFSQWPVGTIDGLAPMPGAGVNPDSGGLADHDLSVFTTDPLAAYTLLKNKHAFHDPRGGWSIFSHRALRGQCPESAFFQYPCYLDRWDPVVEEDPEG